MTDWQPIATAPKDGTEVLAANGCWIEIVCWSEAMTRWVDGSWFTASPTHWMPLPDPPENNSPHPQPF